VNGADLLCVSLQACGVECVFGLPGTQNVPLYEALRRSRLRSVVPTHELAASFMANGYYRASGRPAALVTIPGPGFAYALPGLAEARHDSAALVHVTGQPPAGARRFQFQAIDQQGIAEKLVKGVFHAGSVDELPGAVASAYDLATEGEPGPVLLDYAGHALEDVAPRAPSGTRPPRAGPPVLADTALQPLAARLTASRRPLIMAGQGCAGVAAGLRELAELIRAPVLTTLSGRGVLPEDHELALGFEFSRGDVRVLNELIRESGCVLAVGCKLTSAGTECFQLDLPPDRLIHVDASVDVLGATYPAALTLVASAESFLGRLVPVLRDLRVPAAPGWTPDEIGAWKRRLRAPGPQAGPDPVIRGVGAAAFFAALRRVLPRDGIVVTDSGWHQTVVRRHMEVYSPRTLIVPSDFQSMGFGLPAAIGAKLAAPARAVVAVIGDGGFAMTGMEMLTAVREGVAVTVVVFNDGYLNRIRLQQLAQYGHSEGCDVLNPGFEEFARAVGVGYARCEGDVEGTLQTAIGCGHPTLLEVRVGDTLAVRSEAVKGVGRGMARRALPNDTRRWLRRIIKRS